MGRIGRIAVVLLVSLICLGIPRHAWALLRPDELALVINENVPESRRLAEYYAKMRQVPQERIIALRLPAGDEITFDQYERDVYRPVREYLLERGLTEQVKCLVTFYGMPLRVGAHRLERDEQLEINDLKNQTVQVRPRIDRLVEKLEEIAQRLDPGFTPERRTDMDALARRAERAFATIGEKLGKLNDPQKQQALYKSVLEVLGELGGPAAILRHDARVLNDPALPEERQRLLRDKLGELATLQRRLVQMQSQRYDPAIRLQNRDLVKQYFGLLAYAQLLEGQLAYFKPEQSVAALDSELALLWWGYYMRANWITNPLYFEIAGPAPQPLLMVSRLDAPQAGEVGQMILASLKAEREGLRGRVAIDARGIAPINAKGEPDGYGQYDQTLRNLARIVQERTELPLTFDDRPEVFAPGTVKDVAIYVGWYSLRNYIPAFSFVPGAVGYHIASFEMTTLRDPKENLWVKGLLGDGIAATLGPVDEPYTLAFPRPDRFFPLLLTGKLTLAEVYWHTQPTASWRVALIGDPLYRPFSTNPALAVEQLPDELRRLIAPDSPTTQPTAVQGDVGDGR